MGEVEVKQMKQRFYTHPRLTAIFPGLPRWAGTRKAKPIWILLKQETVTGSGISWNICKSAPRSRQITMPAPHHSVFYRPDALPATQPTASKHWRQRFYKEHKSFYSNKKHPYKKQQSNKQDEIQWNVICVKKNNSKQEAQLKQINQVHIILEMFVPIVLLKLMRSNYNRLSVHFWLRY